MEKFRELGIAEPILRGLEELGFETPTNVQEKAIPLLLESDHDVVVLARTGTGKTAAFGIPLLQKLDPSIRVPQALVLSPTRELCCQISSDLKRYGAFMGNVEVLPIYGGAGIREQISGLRRNPQVIVATPGRLIDHLTRGTVDLSGIRTLVLDEADEMLSMGFKDELETILKTTPDTKKTCLFSATMPAGIRSIAKGYLHSAVELAVTGESAEKVQIEHRYYLVNSRDRSEALRRLVARESDLFGIVFCRTKETTKQVANLLSEDGYAADALHGDLSQVQRDYVMNRFRRGVVKLLIATDVAARGLDVDDLTHVVHYELPDDIEGYVHRSGRTARAGKSGVSLSIVSPREVPRIRRLESSLGTRFTKAEVPNGRDILKSRISDFIDLVEGSEADESGVDGYLPEVLERLQDIPKEELIKRFLHVQMKDQLETYAAARDIEQPSAERRFERSFGSGRPYGRSSDSYGSNRPSGNNRGGYSSDRGGYKGRSDDSRGREDYRGRDNFGGRDGYQSGGYQRSGSNGGFRSSREGFEGAARPRFTPNSGSGDLVGVRIPVGKANGMTKGALIGLVKKCIGGAAAHVTIGEIDIQKRMTIVEVPRDSAKHLAQQLSGSVV